MGNYEYEESRIRKEESTCCSIRFRRNKLNLTAGKSMSYFNVLTFHLLMEQAVLSTYA
jgi:hypothetical protein